MAKFVTTQENPDEHEKALGFVQKYQETKKENSVDFQVFSKDALQQLIEHPDFHSARFHHGRLEDGTRSIIVEGLGPKGESLNTFVFDGPTCPPYCEQ